VSSKTRIGVSFAFFWPGFTPDQFMAFFPFVYEKYDFVLSSDPEVAFYSAFSPQFKPYDDPRVGALASIISPGNYIRVFLSGENFEPFMEHCDFAITFSTRTRHPNHLRLPLGVYENRGWGYGPNRLVKAPNTDWKRVAQEKTAFCNFVYNHDVAHRNSIFAALSEYKRVDAAGRCCNNMNGWTVPLVPNRLQGKLGFLRRYKFTLAIENSVWPGYMTEKLVDPMFVNSIPIYVGDPQAKLSFDPGSYIDSTCFPSIVAMLDYVRGVDNNPELYREMLAAPFYRDNRVPDYARDETILEFFDRIVQAALTRRRSRSSYAGLDTDRVIAGAHLIQDGGDVGVADVPSHGRYRSSRTGRPTDGLEGTLLSIIIPARNNAALTARCVRSALHSVDSLNLHCQFILVDDASEADEGILPVFQQCRASARNHEFAIIKSEAASALHGCLFHRPPLGKSGKHIISEQRYADYPYILRRLAGRCRLEPRLWHRSRHLELLRHSSGASNCATECGQQLFPRRELLASHF